MLIRFCAADHEPPSQEFLVVQLLDCAPGLLDGLHLNKGKPFRALVVPIAYDLRILHVPHAVEEFEEIALRGVEGQVADVQTRRRNLDDFRLARRARGRRAIARSFPGCALVVCEKCDKPLPECLFLCFRFSLPTARPAVAPFSGTAARTT